MSPLARRGNGPAGGEGRATTDRWVDRPFPATPGVARP